LRACRRRAFESAIVRLLRGKYALLNMIPYNAVEGLGFDRPQAERAEEIARELHRRGVLTELRQSAGQDVDAGCGQLRARSVAAQGEVRVGFTKLARPDPNL
jgi:23S rRNA (adenine2503-C2)-methyltransferase